eukprot:COSAG02_NODE_38786_length_425_cov_0.561350_1_plen_22_part_10
MHDPAVVGLRSMSPENDPVARR